MGLFDKVKNMAGDALDKGKDLATDAMKKDEENGSVIKEKISQGISDAVKNVMKERKEFYSNNPSPDINSIRTIIDNYSNKNAIISGGAGLIPGPWGMAAAIPEILAVTNNQIKMVYDIAQAHNQETITTELLIGVLFGAMGQSATSLVVIQGQKVMAKRVGARALQSVIKALGGKITQQLAKSMAAKWLPIAGAVAMATWSKYSTNKIGDKAIEIFSKDIIFDDNTEVFESEIIIEDNNIESQNIISKVKIESLINLMKIDGNIDDDEVEFIENFIDKSELSNEEQMSLIEQIGNSSKIQIDYSIFKEDKEEGLYLLIDLIALAKADGEFHITEKMFIKGIAKILEFDQEDMKELME